MRSRSVIRVETKKNQDMRKTFLTLILLTASAALLSAQSEYRITQELPNDIDRLELCSGWEVRLRQAPQSSLTIVTPCQAFYDEAGEPQVCTIKERELTLNENRTMPHSTVIEIALAAPLYRLYIGENAIVGTERLRMTRNCHVNIHHKATVRGTTWVSDSNLSVDIYWGALLELDTLQAAERLDVDCLYDATLRCPTMLSNNTRIKKDKRSMGTSYATDTNLNIKVKQTNKRWLYGAEKLSLNVGTMAPVPLYMNNRGGSAYNRGENYQVYVMIGLGPYKLTNRWRLHARVMEEFGWSRLLNQVTTDGNSLSLSATPTADAPQQHLYSTSVGLDLTFSYAIGKQNAETGWGALNLNFGLSALTVGGGTLVTREMWDDNRWHIVQTKVNVFNPFQLRAHVGIGGDPLTRATVNLVYDLLPTFRSGIGAKDVHTFGVSVSF